MVGIGGLYVDRSGLYEGRLIVVTDVGKIWVISPNLANPAVCGATEFYASAGEHLEGVIVVPNNATQWGGLAGKIIAGAEDSSKMYAIGKDKVLQSWTVPVKIEDLDYIYGDENFFGVNYGTGKILGVPAASWAKQKGTILATQGSEATILY